MGTGRRTVPARPKNLPFRGSVGRSDPIFYDASDSTPPPGFVSNNALATAYTRSTNTRAITDERAIVHARRTQSPLEAPGWRPFACYRDNVRSLSNIAKG